MKLLKKYGYALAGFAAGTVNGLLGAGGGMVLVPILGTATNLEDKDIFPASVSIILPICLVSFLFSLPLGSFPWESAVFYLAGSAAGGILAGHFSRKIPTKWLHRALGLLIIWGGIRYLW